MKLRVLVPKTLYERVREAAHSNNLSISEFIRMHIRQIPIRHEPEGNLWVDTTIVVSKEEMERVESLAERMGNASKRAAVQLILSDSVRGNGACVSE
jgi:hypothetical protein